MLLVMDVGNTHIVLGLFQGDELLHHWRIQTDRNATEDEYAMLLKSLFEHVGIRMEEIDGVSISSVVPPLKRSEEHTSELQSRENLVCRLLLEKKKEENIQH